MVLPALDSTMGAMLIGVVISACLFGISVTQSFWYYSESGQDPIGLKILVGVLMAFDGTHLALIGHSIYYYTISNFFNPLALGTLVWSLAVEALFTCLTGALVQLFYTHRVWRLSKGNVPITVLLLALILGNTGCQVAWVTLALKGKTFAKLLAISKLTHAINGLTAGIDVIIAVVLVTMLVRAKTGFKKSDTIITRLIIFIVNTGALTSACALASLIALAVSTTTLIYAPFYFCIGRLYTNSLLATLNARSTIRGDTTKDSSHMLVSIPQNVAGAGTASNNRGHGISIRVETTKEQMGSDHSVSISKSEEGYLQKNEAL